MSEIQITIVAFGIARDIIGGNSMKLNLEEGSTASSAMAILKEKYPDFEKLNSLKLAINEEYVDDHQFIHANDELVLIPPVSGG